MEKVIQKAAVLDLAARMEVQLQSLLFSQLSAASDCTPLRLNVVTECNSTNSQLLQRARSTGLDGLEVLVALRQTAGRGRMGRTWQSESLPAGRLEAGVGGTAPCGITFSVACRYAPASWQALSLAVGVALAQALGAAVRLKWPNDLWVALPLIPNSNRVANRGVKDENALQRPPRWGKLGGILIETVKTPSGETAVVVGVGVNVFSSEPGLAAHSAQNDRPATYHRAALDQLDAALPPPSLEGALIRCIPAVCEALRRFEREGLAPWLAEFAARDALRGQPVQVVNPYSGAVAHHGTARGINAQGALMLELENGAVQAIESLEVSLRPTHEVF